jgi:hypothetical protein
MTIADLVKFKSKLVGGFANEIEIVIANLGKTSGRNIRPPSHDVE